MEREQEQEQSKRSWNYRVIEFVTVLETWREIREVHYDSGVPVGYSAVPADVSWFPNDVDNDSTPIAILDRMREALSKPVLTAKDFERKG
jgi:hypothetical protein